MERNQAVGGVVAVYNNLRRASGHGMGHKRDRRHHPDGYGDIGLALDLAVSPSAAVGMAVNDVRACPDIIDGNADITNAPPQLVQSLPSCSIKCFCSIGVNSNKKMNAPESPGRYNSMMKFYTRVNQIGHQQSMCFVHLRHIRLM